MIPGLPGNQSLAFRFQTGFPLLLDLPGPAIVDKRLIS
jgi:hypothetical protein